MPRRLVRRAPASLLLIALAPLAGAQGVTLAPWAAVAVALVMGVLGAFALIRGVRVPPEALGVAALVGWAVVVGVARHVPLGSAGWLVATGAVAAALLVLAEQPRARRWALIAVLAAALVSAVWMLAGRLAGEGRPGGALDQSVLSATLVLLGLAVLPALRLSLLSRLASATVLLAGLVASGARGALLGAVALGLLWGWRVRSPRVRRAAVAIVVVAAAGLGWRLWRDRDPLRWERVRIWGVAVATVRAEAPLGAGPGGYADAALGHNFPRVGEFALFNRDPGLAESDPLQLAATLGVVGVLLGIALVVVVLRRSTAEGWSVLAALAITSAVNTQLPVPAVAWTAALAVAATMRRPSPRWRLRASLPLAAAGAVAFTVAVGLALSWPRPGLGDDPAALLARAVKVGNAGDGDVAFADAEALALRAAEARPRWAEAWTVLGAIRLERGLGRRDASEIAAAKEAYRRARAANPHNPFAVLGEARCADALSRGAEARALTREALRIEPNFVRAWLRLGELELEDGRISAACAALHRADDATGRATRVVFVSDYERSLAAGAPALRAVLKRACGGAP